MKAAWLADDVLLAAFRASGGHDELAAAKRALLEAESKAFEGPAETVVAAWGREAVQGAGVAAALTDLRTFLREGPAGWDAATRWALLDFLADLGAEHGLSASLGDGLRRAREALRERRPVTVGDRRAGRGVAVERFHRIDARSFYVRGRAWDEAAPIARLAATSPEGKRVDLLDRVFRHSALEAGFVGLFQVAAPTRGAGGWVVEAESEGGRTVEVEAALEPDPLNTLFADAARGFDGAEELRERHLRPAIARLNELRRARTDIVELGSHGAVPAVPPVSLVVPLQRRVDLIEHQLAQFVADPELRECELLYVLEDPEQGEALEELTAELFGLYGLPMRIAALTEAAGLPVACNLGAGLARAERLVFLGSDVLPDRPGWLGALAAALDADAETAAATPKLLFADQAIDQAGLEYAPLGGGAELSIRHRLRGMHRGIAAAKEPAEVEAAGLACLMIEAADFEATGGLRTEYRLGTYEGSDLSRRLAERGRGVRYAPAAELYRLEGLGASPEPLGEGYARWLHARQWGERTIGAGR